MSIPKSLWVISCVFLLLHLCSGNFSPKNYGLDQVKGYVAGVGDVNNDKHADLFIIDYDTAAKQSIITIYVWDNGPKTYYPLPNTIKTDKHIANIIPADFDYDGKLDLLVTGVDSKQPEDGKHTYYYVDIYLGDFTKRGDISGPDFSFADAGLELPIGQVSVLDVNGDLKPDLLAMSYNANADDAIEKYRRTFWVYTKDPDNKSGFTYTLHYQDLTSIPENQSAFRYLAPGYAPVLADLNGDCMADLLLVTTNIPPPTPISHLSSASSNEVPTTAYSAGDLTQTNELRLEIWVFDKTSQTNDNKYVFHSSNPLPDGALQPTIGDFNADGAIDIIIPQCFPLSTCEKNNDLHIWYNKQRSMCSSPVSTGSGCRKQQHLCTADHNFTFNNFSTSITDENNNNYVHIAGEDLFQAGERFYQPNSALDLTYYNPPFAIRVGDVDLDTRFDLFFPLHKGDQVRYGTFTMTPCVKGGSCSPIAVDNDLYTVTDLPVDGIPVYSSTTPSDKDNQHNANRITHDHIIYSSVLLDLGNSGSLDLLLLHRPKSLDNDVRQTSAPPSRRSLSTVFTDLLSSIMGALTPQSPSPSPQSDEASQETLPSGSPHFKTDPRGTGSTHNQIGITAVLPPPPAVSGIVTSYTNSFRTDAYFLTLMAGNGVCDAWCSSGPKFPNPKPFGAHHIGATFKFTVTALNGKKTPRISQQIPSTAYLGLHTPYQMLGLGRTNNYIEELFLGVPNTLGDHSNLWVAMIPNSQIVVFPNPPSSSSEWTLELFISPTQRLLWVGIAFITTTLACVVTIAILHVREKNEEKKARGQRQHLFAF